MKHWRAAIGFLVTGILAMAGFFIVGVKGETPEWFSAILGVVGLLCNTMGITFINPFAKRDESGNIIAK